MIILVVKLVLQGNNLFGTGWWLGDSNQLWLRLRQSLVDFVIMIALGRINTQYLQNWIIFFHRLGSNAKRLLTIGSYKTIFHNISVLNLFGFIVRKLIDRRVLVGFEKKMRTFSIRLIIKYPPLPVIFLLRTELLLIYHWNSSVLTFSFMTKKVNFPLPTMPFQSITSILSHHWFYICTTLFHTDLYLKFTLSLRRF